MKMLHLKGEHLHFHRVPQTASALAVKLVLPVKSKLPVGADLATRIFCLNQNILTSQSEYSTDEVGWNNDE